MTLTDRLATRARAARYGGNVDADHSIRYSIRAKTRPLPAHDRFLHDPAQNTTLNLDQFWGERSTLCFPIRQYPLGG